MSDLKEKNLLSVAVFLLAIVLVIGGVIYFQPQDAQPSSSVTLSKPSYELELLETNGRPTAVLLKHLDNIQEKPITLELAITPDSREKGLMFRDYLGPHDGMIFIFPHSKRRSFWMKNCLIDIDMIFVESDGRVDAVHQAKMQPPGTPDRELLSYPSNRPVPIVIELAGKRAREWGINQGDIMDLPFKELRAIAK